MRPAPTPQINGHARTRHDGRVHSRTRRARGPECRVSGHLALLTLALLAATSLAAQRSLAQPADPRQGWGQQTLIGALPAGTESIWLSLEDAVDGSLVAWWPSTPLVGRFVSETRAFQSNWNGYAWAAPVDVLLAPYGDVQSSFALGDDSQLHCFSANGCIYHASAPLEGLPNAQGWVMDSCLEP
ncbi:MAG: hypothetical protein GX557_00670, partial [Chloroflexi bacterium]|nr:hypothetical protein [Chloroflexota bacterium]